MYKMQNNRLYRTCLLFESSDQNVVLIHTCFTRLKFIAKCPGSAGVAQQNLFRLCLISLPPGVKKQTKPHICVKMKYNSIHWTVCLKIPSLWKIDHLLNYLACFLLT